AAAQQRFPCGPPTTVFQHGPDRVELWDAEDFDPWETLDWETVRVFFYRQHKPNGTVVEAYWLTNFLSSTVGPQALFRMAAGRSRTKVSTTPRAVTASSIFAII